MNFLVKKTLYLIESVVIEPIQYIFLFLEVLTISCSNFSQLSSRVWFRWCIRIENIVFVRAKKSLVMPCVTFIAFLLGGLRLYRVLNQKKRKKLKFFNLWLNLLGLKTICLS